MPGAITDIIAKMGLDGAPVINELDKINAKYQASNKELEQTQKLLDDLVKKEAALLKARNASTNPTAAAQYKVKIDDVRKSIELTEKSVTSLTKETAKFGKELDTSAAKAKKALDSTKGNAVGQNLLGVAAGFGLITSITAAAGAVKDLISDSVELSAKAEGIATAFSRIGGEETLQKLRLATRGATSDLVLMQAALRAKNFGIAPELLAKGLQLAGQVARTTGQDVDYLTDSFVNGLGRKSLLILDNLQISQVALRAEIKKTGDFNTAVGNIVDAKLRETGIVIETTSDKLANFTAGWANLKKQIGDFLVTTGSGVLDFFKALGTGMTFQNVQNKKSLEIADKAIQEFNGNTLDQAKKSEAERLRLLAESSNRLLNLTKSLGRQTTDEELKSVSERIKNLSGFDRIKAIKERDAIEALKKRTRLEFDLNQLGIQNEKKLNDDLRNLNKERTAVIDEEGAKRLKKERQFLIDLEIDIRRAQSILRSTKSEGAPADEVSELDKIQVKFLELSIQRNIDFEKRRNAINEEIKNEAIKTKVLIQLKTLENIELNTLDEQRLAEIRLFNLRKTSVAIEGAKSVAELDLKIAQAQTTFSLDDSDARIAILVDYTSKKIELMSKEGKDEIEILKFTRDQALAVEEIRKNQLLKLQRQANAEFEEEERFHLAILEYKKRIHQSQITTSEIKFEEKKLKQMRKDYDEQVALTGQQDNEKLLAIEKQENNITLLKKKQRKQERQEIIDQTVFIIENINLVTQAIIDATNKILDAKIKETDTLISLQQKRVDEVAKIAENGNAELLELEKKRLDDLNKEKEKFVRTQQTLASIELVANTAVAVSKAAAEGGAGAAFTIAAALIALVAGLASARSIAGQAAFYDGGYTGDGNPREESSAIGSRPYKYHKAEFVHDHITTKKYRRIFEEVHAGKLDLNRMQADAEMYQILKANGIDTSRDVYLKQPGSNNSMEFEKLKSSFEGVVRAIKEQPGMEVHIDEQGIAFITNRYYKNKQRINAIT